MVYQKIAKKAAAVWLAASLAVGACSPVVCAADTAISGKMAGGEVFTGGTAGLAVFEEPELETETSETPGAPETEGNTEAPSEDAGNTETQPDTDAGVESGTEASATEAPVDEGADTEAAETENSDTEQGITEAEPDTGKEGTTEEESQEELTEGGSEEWTEEETSESEIFEEMEEEADLIEALAQADLTPSGSPVVGAAGWTPASMATGFSPDFYPVRFYGGVSRLEVFNQSQDVVLTYYNGRPAFYPTKGGQGGKFGAIYRKVLYDGSRWYDLRMTVSGYTTSVRSDGGAKVTSYPYIAFTPNEIGWKFNTALGGVVMKCEFLDSATGAASALNTRFQWWDVDAAQRFGLKTASGSIAGRYYNAGGSTVYHQNNVSIAGVSGMETVVGQSENALNTDPAYCIAYELRGCSTYYMGIDVRDHIEDDANSYTKTQLERVNRDLAAGKYTGTVEELRQTDTSLNKIHTPAPIKSVSNNASAWAEQNTLASVDGTYWYQIRQFVPWQSSNAYYTSFVIKDVLPAGADYAGSLKIMREEDGADVTGWFTVSSNQNVIMATASSSTRSSASFYGYHYTVRFCVKMNAGKIQPVYKGDRAEYTLQNHAETIVQHSTDSSYLTERSNVVTTLASLERKEQAAPVKGLDGKKETQQKVLKMENEKITYSIFQEVPVNGNVFLPTRIVLTDELEDCLQFESAEVKLRKAGSAQWEVQKGWAQENNGQTVRLSAAYAPEYGGGTLLFNLTCRIRKDYDLLPWQTRKGEEGAWTTIPNKAAVTFEWAKGDPLFVEKETNEVYVKLKEVHLKLTKEIDTEDIVWAHGNPTFTFRVEGIDLSGKEHVWYQTLEFAPGNAGGGEKALLTADFIVPVGNYTATEEKTMRYRLEKIYGVAGGTASGNQVDFSLSDAQDGAAVFYNKKTTDEEESHTAFARNHIGS